MWLPAKTTIPSTLKEGEDSDEIHGDVEDNDEEEHEEGLAVPPLDQHGKPKVGDVISYGIELGTEHERWAEASITSISSTPHYYNIRRLDTREVLGIYLLPNTAWHFGHRLECERQPPMHPNSRETSPLLLMREERVLKFEFELDYLGEPLRLPDGSSFDGQ